MMRWLSLRMLLGVVFLAAVVTASVYALGIRRHGAPQRYMNVGGVNNPCTCTQRLER
jgi:hypothetical protein